MNINEIITQMGGIEHLKNTVQANFLNDRDALVVRFQRSPKANVLKIKLNGLDLYDMTFYFQGHDPCNLGLQKTGLFKDVYDIQIKEIFNEFTGLHI